MRYSGADWLERQGVALSTLGRNVADILGYVERGIYHLDGIEKQDFSDPRVVVINLRVRLATCDSNKLTTLVLACHKMAVRLEIRPCNMQSIRLVFHQRTRSGGFADCHPTIETALREFNDECDLEKVFSYPEEQAD